MREKTFKVECIQIRMHRLVVLFCLTLLLASYGCSPLLPTGQVTKEQKPTIPENLSKYLEPQEVVPLLNTQGIIIIDLREDWQYRTGHVAGSKNIPLTDLSRIRLQAEDVTEKDRLIIYDDFSKRSESAYTLLQSYKMMRVQIMTGGFIKWQNLSLPVREGYNE